MSDTTVSQIHSPTEDALTAVLKRGTEELLAKAVEAEVVRLLERYEHLRVDGKQAVVRNGYLPERTIQTGVGEVSVKVPKVRDRSGQGIKFNSALLPPYLKRTQVLEEFIPWLYLKRGFYW
jgi:putative transposase